jgi:hypothetical protein
MQLYLQHIACDRRPVLAGDHAAWPRPTAYTPRDRTVEHQPDPVPGGPPITLGHGFSTLVWVDHLGAMAGASPGCGQTAPLAEKADGVDTRAGLPGDERCSS